MQSKTRLAKKASYPKHSVPLCVPLTGDLRRASSRTFGKVQLGTLAVCLKPKCYFVWPLKSKDIKSASDYLRGLSEQPRILHVGSFSRWLTLHASFPDLVHKSASSSSAPKLTAFVQYITSVDSLLCVMSYWQPAGSDSNNKSNNLIPHE